MFVTGTFYQSRLRRRPDIYQNLKWWFVRFAAVRANLIQILVECLLFLSAQGNFALTEGWLWAVNTKTARY
jgi:hypothetical protein